MSQKKGNQGRPFRANCGRCSMSWLSRLLSPSKRRVDESSLPPKKRARSLEDELTADKAPSTEYPYDEAELIQYSAKDSSKALGSLLLR